MKISRRALKRAIRLVGGLELPVVIEFVDLGKYTPEDPDAMISLGRYTPPKHELNPHPGKHYIKLNQNLNKKWMVFGRNNIHNQAVWHELRHAWQYENRPWVLLGEIDKVMSFDEYYNHPCEVDARKYEVKCTEYPRVMGWSLWRVAFWPLKKETIQEGLTGSIEVH